MGYSWDLGTHCNRDHHRRASQPCDEPWLPDLPHPSEFPWGQPPTYRIPGPENGVVGRVCRGPCLLSQFPQEFHRVQGPGYCHGVQGISKKHICQGGMAASVWRCSVGAVRDNHVADYSAPGINTMRCIAYCPPIAISPVLLALSVSYFKPTIWHCGQLWLYDGMGSSGTHLHRDCNAMGDAAKISPCVPSTFSSRSVRSRWEDTIVPSSEDPRNLGKSKCDQSLGKIVCVFSLYDKMRWKWDAVYLPRGLPNIYSTSLIPPPLPLYLRTPTVAPKRYTWRLWSIQWGDVLWGCDRASLEMQLQAMNERDWRSTWRWSIWREARWQLWLYSLVNL